jgi:osmotically inducible protein OsmC
MRDLSRLHVGTIPSCREIVMDRNASVLLKGALRAGSGTMTTESGVLSDTQYSFQTRFAEGIGTNPDELMAASLGGCFSMFLANELGLSGFHPKRIETNATATLEDWAAGWTLTHIQLDVHADVPDASQAHFTKTEQRQKTVSYSQKRESSTLPVD